MLTQKQLARERPVTQIHQRMTAVAQCSANPLGVGLEEEEAGEAGLFWFAPVATVFHDLEDQ